MTINMPYQLFINGEFVDSESGRTFETINPTDETVRKTSSCHLQFSMPLLDLEVFDILKRLDLEVPGQFASLLIPL